MAAKPGLLSEYLQPPTAAEPEPLPEEFSATRLRRSLLTLAAVVLLVVAALVLVPGLASLRERFAGARPGWLVLAGFCKCCRALPTSWSSAQSSASE